MLLPQINTDSISGLGWLWFLSKNLTKEENIYYQLGHNNSNGNSNIVNDSNEQKMKNRQTRYRKYRYLLLDKLVCNLL